VKSADGGNAVLQKKDKVYRKVFRFGDYNTITGDGRSYGNMRKNLCGQPIAYGAARFLSNTLL